MNRQFAQHVMTCLAACFATAGLAQTGGAGGSAAKASAARIAEEAIDSSELRENLFQLTDAIGPRVVGSPAIRQAEAWVAERLRTYGLRNVRVEANPPVAVAPGVSLNPPGWSWSRLTVQQLAPWSQTLLAVPVMYSPATPGAVTGDVAVVLLPRPVEADLAAFISRHRGTLRDKFLLLAERESEVPLGDGPGYHRYTQEELKALAAPEAPAPRVPAAPAATAPRAPAEPPPSPSEIFARYTRLYDFLRAEGVLGLVGPARRGSQAGVLIVNGPPAPPVLAAAPPPMLDMTPEHFNRLLRLTQRKIPVRLEVRLDSQFHEHTGTENVIGEVTGNERADEVVLVGAHIDSWHGGTGATDNAAGVATVLEAVRLLSTMQPTLRRSVHVAFWGGEELFNFAGSRGYAQRYLLDPTGQPNDAHRRLSAYLNLDYGSGRIRGIYLQGNDKLKPLFDTWLSGIGDGSLVATTRTTLGSDQATFERIGIPGLSFVQDPLNYEQRTHHTTMDEPDYVVLSDLRQSAATLANVIYRIANADSLLPRKTAR